MGNANDFEGYKLYRATDKKISDPEIITDGFGNPLLRQPIYQGDLINNIAGFADYGEVNGVEFYLGNNSGIRNSFVDRTVQNGRTYYYVLVAYDYGVPEVSDGIPPSENTFTLLLDQADDIVQVSKNVAVVTPHAPAAGYVAPELEVDASVTAPGTAPINLEVLNPDALKEDNVYQIEFSQNLVTRLITIGSQRHPFDQFSVTTGYRIFNVTSGSKVLVHQEGINRFFNRNFIRERVEIDTRGEFEFWSMNPDGVISGAFEGIQVTFDAPVRTPSWDASQTGWLQGDAPLSLVINDEQSAFFPWKYDIMFGESDTTKSTIVDEVRNSSNRVLPERKLLTDQTFDFKVVNSSILNEDGEYEVLDLVVFDADSNGVYDVGVDTIYAGYTTPQRRGGSRWAATVFGMAFDPSDLPGSGDVYRVLFNRPYYDTDSLRFKVKSLPSTNAAAIASDMDKIRVVPNPYIATNLMEEAVTNSQLSQRRKLAFTHLPAQCTIKIYTISGVLVDEIEVNNSTNSRQSSWDTNSQANGSAFWDLQTREGLSISAGYYIYHIRSHATGEEKIGKFAIIK